MPPRWRAFLSSVLEYAVGLVTTSSNSPIVSPRFALLFNPGDDFHRALPICMFLDFDFLPFLPLCPTDGRAGFFFFFFFCVFRVFPRSTELAAASLVVRESFSLPVGPDFFLFSFLPLEIRIGKRVPSFFSSKLTLPGGGVSFPARSSLSFSSPEAGVVL